MMKQLKAKNGACAFLSVSNAKAHNINKSMQQIQQKAATEYHWEGFAFINSELRSVNDFDDLKCPYYDIKQTEDHTAVSPQELSKVKVKTFSKKKRTPKYEISFEKGFMKEHKAVFRKQYQNYIESIRRKTISEIIQSTPMCFFKSQNKESNQSALDLLKTDFVTLTNKEKNQFSKDLQHELTFQEFLDFVVEQCAPNMAGSLISVAQTLWMAYVPFQNRDMKVARLVQLGQKVAKTDVKGSLIKYFAQTLPKLQEISEDLLKLLEIFCTTALLTITGYFENPYFNDDAQIHGLKRPWNSNIFSDQEEDSFDSWQSIPTYKKRKPSDQNNKQIS